jgi:small subunit ribosomal protein S7
VSKRVTSADPVFGDVLVAKMIHAIMLEGRKCAAEKVVYGSMEVLREKTKEDPVAVLKKAIENAKPLVEVKSRRVGGATYQVPIEVRPERRLSLSIRWLVSYSRARAEKTMIARLSGELLDAFNNRGTTIKKKEDTHKMAEANKAFAHYRW